MGLSIFAARRLTISALLSFLLAGAAHAADDLAVREEAAMKAALRRVANSVVRVETLGAVERAGTSLAGSGIGSGLVVSSDGYIVTSAWDFRERPASVLVRLADGQRLAAKIIAQDRSRMIVLLKVNPPAPLAEPESVPSAQIEVGWWALAVGRTYEAGTPNLSVGIVSAVDRVSGKAIQTDAKISPSNYGGPLVDIAGRVMGVLVPLPVEAAGDMSGSELYDSGIGFAVPFDHIRRVLPRLEQGEDLLPGVLGISLASDKIFAPAATIAAVRPGSPAHKSGLQAGDTIVAVGGQPVTRVTDVKRQLNRSYAGDKLRIAVLREGKRTEVESELVAKLPPYENPFLGILPATGTGTGCTVRYVFEGSPAALAGIKPGDRIVKIGATALADAGALRVALQQKMARDVVRLSLARQDKTEEVEVRLARTPESLPGEVPPPARPAAKAPATKPPTGVVPIKLPDVENKCFALVPQAYADGAACGLVVWLHGSGEFKQDEVVARWRPLCEKHRLILLAPQARATKETGAWAKHDMYAG